jgi:hypothetical protein
MLNNQSQVAFNPFNNYSLKQIEEIERSSSFIKPGIYRNNEGTDLKCPYECLTLEDIEYV